MTVFMQQNKVHQTVFSELLSPVRLSSVCLSVCL